MFLVIDLFVIVVVALATTRRLEWRQARDRSEAADYGRRQQFRRLPPRQLELGGRAAAPDTQRRVTLRPIWQM